MITFIYGFLWKTHPVSLVLQQTVDFFLSLKFLGLYALLAFTFSYELEVYSKSNFSGLLNS